MPHCALGSGDLLVGEGRKPELDNDLLVDSERSSTNLPLVPRRALERARAEARGSRRDGSRTKDQSTVLRLIQVHVLGEYRCANPFCHAVLINHGMTCSRSESRSFARREANRSKKVRLIT